MTDLVNVIYPPKYPRQTVGEINWVLIVRSLLVYLVAGYLLLQNWMLLLILGTILLLHELGHFFAMKYYGYEDLGIFFIPFLGGYVKGSKQEISQKESAIIFLAGPVPGILIGFIMMYSGGDAAVGGIAVNTIGFLFLLLNGVNLLPIYPLDGGQLLNRVFLEEEEKWVAIATGLSVLLLIGVAVYTAFYLLVLFPLWLIWKLRRDKRIDSISQKLEQADINTMITYKELSDKDYWRIRTVLIECLPQFKHVEKGPPFQYDEEEEKISEIVDGALDRLLLYDMTILGKIIVIIVWLLVLIFPVYWLYTAPGNLLDPASWKLLFIKR